VEVNDALGDHPETVNGDPYGDGWLCVIEVANEAELQSLLDASAYRALIEG
jgi:glycine cleavage system H protein